MAEKKKKTAKKSKKGKWISRSLTDSTVIELTMT